MDFSDSLLMLLDRSMTNKKNYKAYFPTNQMSKDKT
jgi:hypothetical protein